MARVVCWPTQLAGSVVVRAGWPGSNGSVIGTNAAALDGAAVDAAALDGAAGGGALPAALAVVVVPDVAPPAVDELEPPQPASMAVPMARMATMASLPPVVPRALPLIWHPPRDS